MKLLTKAEAATRCRVSLAAFDAHVRPALTPKKIGRRVLFLESDIDAWAETASPSNAAPAKRGPSPARAKTPSGTRGSGLLDALLSDPQAQQTKSWLTSKPQSSSRQLEQVSSESQPSPVAKVLRLPSRTC